MGAVIAGWAAGHAMAIVTTVAAIYLLTQASPKILDRLVDPEVSRALLGVPVFIGAKLAWTIVGLAIGSIYEVGGFSGGKGMLFAPSIGFAGAMVAVGLMPVGILAALWSRFWWLWLLLAISFAAAFGWGMPVLAAQW